MAKKKRAFRNPNGYGSVVKLGGNRRKPFAARVTVGWTDDKQIYKYLGYYEKREEAMASLADYNRGLLTIDTNTATFKDMADRWLEMGTKEMKEASIKQYILSFNRCEPLYKHRMVDINADAIQQLLDNGGLSKSTNIQTRSFIKQVFDYAIANKVVTFSPVGYVKIRGKEKKEGVRFEDEHIEWLWNNRHLKFVDLFLVLAYTGMRIEELLTLPKSAVNLEERYMIWGMKTESGKERVIPISKKIIPVLENMMTSPTSRVIEYKGKKLKYGALNVYFKKYLPLMKADKTHTIHDFRRTTTSMLSDADVPLTTIQKIVGHKPTDVTSQVYIQKSLTSLLKAIDKI